MGAYLRARLTHSDEALEAQKYLNKLQENKILRNMDLGIHVVNSKDIDIVNKDESLAYNHKKQIIRMLKNDLGRIDYKVSGIDFDDIDISGSDFFNLVSKVFILLNQKFKIRYLCLSCAFDTQGFHYLSLENMKAVTQNGRLLSGKSSYPKEYSALFNILNG